MPPRVQSTEPSKLLPPILRHLQSTPPDAYSAHQKARTTAARLIHSSHEDAAIEVLFGASKELLKVREWGSGCDLGCYLVQVYTSSAVEVTSESRARITQLLALLTGQGAWRKKLADAAIKWSSECGSCPTGDPDLHQYLGELYYKDHAFAQAEIHLIASCKRDAAVVLADMMYEWCGHGEQDPGPFALRAVLPYISVTPPAIAPAHSFLSHFLTRLSSLPSFVHSTLPVPDSDSDSQLLLTSSQTLNFLQLAVLTIQRAPKEGTSGVQARGTTGGIGKEWEGLVRRYRSSGGISEQAVQEAILHISTNTFLIPPPRQAGGPDLMSLMGSLFGGGSGGPGGGSLGGAGGAPRIR